MSDHAPGVDVLDELVQSVKSLLLVINKVPDPYPATAYAIYLLLEKGRLKIAEKEDVLQDVSEVFYNEQPSVRSGLILIQKNKKGRK